MSGSSQTLRVFQKQALGFRTQAAPSGHPWCRSPRSATMSSTVVTAEAIASAAGSSCLRRGGSVGPSGAFPVQCLSTGGYERMEASGARATRPTATNSRHPGSQMGLGKKGRDLHHRGHRSRLKPLWPSPPLSGCACALQRRRTPRGLQAMLHAGKSLRGRTPCN